MSFEPRLKKKISKEAATLLYLGIEKEYKQAKVKAAKTFGIRKLPSNLEIALELDKISEEKARRKDSEPSHPHVSVVFCSLQHPATEHVQCTGATSGKIHLPFGCFCCIKKRQVDPRNSEGGS